MIIERVLHVRGSEMGFYDSAIFSSYSQLKEKFPDGRLFAHGKALSPDYTPKAVYANKEAAIVLGEDNGECAEAIFNNSILPVDQFFNDGTELWYFYDAAAAKYKRLMCYHCQANQYLVHEEVSGRTVYKTPSTLTNYKIYYVASYKDPETSDYTIPRVIDLDAFVTAYPEWTWGSVIPYDTVKSLFISNPLVPPGRVFEDMYNQTHDTAYMDYWLGNYNGKTPDFIVPHQTKHMLPTTISGQDLVYNSETVVFRPQRTLPIVNGFAVFPIVGSDGKLHATGATQYLADRAHRNRQSVLVDFTPVSKMVAFTRLKDLNGSIKEFALPEYYNSDEYSVIVIIDGRILIPGEDYTLMGRNVIPNPSIFVSEIEADRLLTTGVMCLNDATNVITVNGERDFYNSDDSFVVIVNCPNLQILQHPAWFSSKERRLEQGSSSYSSLHRNMFDSAARGLLFDKSLRAVHDYARETRDVTFYAEENSSVITWGSSSTFITPEKPLVVLHRTTADNLMSAKLMLFDKARRFVPGDQVIWPKYVILDFIFRG